MKPDEVVLQIFCIIPVRNFFWPGCHRMEPYRTLYPEAGRNLPHTEEVAGRVIVLPTGTAVEPEMIWKIGELLKVFEGRRS